MLGVLASYQIGDGWERGRALPLHDRLPAHAGHRRLLRRAQRSYEPIFGAHNSIRIPAFYQLDVRVERTFVFRRGKVNIFLDVQNLTNRKNPEEIIYNYNFSQRAYITGLPTLAVLGARVEF